MNLPSTFNLPIGIDAGETPLPGCNVSNGRLVGVDHNLGRQSTSSVGNDESDASASEPRARPQAMPMQVTSWEPPGE